MWQGRRSAWRVFPRPGRKDPRARRRLSRNLSGWPQADRSRRRRWGWIQHIRFVLLVCAQSAACVLRTDSPAQAELQQILDVLEGDEISLDDLASAFLVYKVSPDSEDIEVVLRDYTDGEWGSRVLSHLDS